MWETWLEATLQVHGRTSAELKLDKEKDETVEKYAADAQLTQLIKNCNVNEVVQDALKAQLPNVTCEKTRILLTQAIETLHVDVDIRYSKILR